MGAGVRLVSSLNGSGFTIFGPGFDYDSGRLARVFCTTCRLWRDAKSVRTSVKLWETSFAGICRGVIFLRFLLVVQDFAHPQHPQRGKQKEGALPVQAMISYYLLLCVNTSYLLIACWQHAADCSSHPTSPTEQRVVGLVLNNGQEVVLAGLVIIGSSLRFQVRCHPFNGPKSTPEVALVRVGQGIPQDCGFNFGFPSQPTKKEYPQNKTHP